MTVGRELDRSIVNFVGVIGLEDDTWTYSVGLGENSPHESIHYLGA